MHIKVATVYSLYLRTVNYFLLIVDHWIYGIIFVKSKLRINDISFLPTKWLTVDCSNALIISCKARACNKYIVTRTFFSERFQILPNIIMRLIAMLMKLQNVLYKTRNKLVMYYRAVVDLFDFRIFHTFPLFFKGNIIYYCRPSLSIFLSRSINLI